MRADSLAALGRWPAARSWPWYLAGALIYLSFGFTEMMGSDLWWHIAAGREIVQSGSVWLVDDWSFTELGSPWRNHEWLADLIFYAWVSLFGIPSLVLWKWLLIVGSFSLLQSVLERVSGSPAAAMLACALAVAVAAPFMDMRPQLYTLLGIALLLRLALLRKPRLVELLPLFLCWANLHGGFVFGLMLLGILRFPWRALSLAGLREALITVLLCTAVCLLNPDGLRIFWLPLVYALDDSSPYRSIAEWRSPFEAGGIVSPLYLYTMVAAPALILLWLLPTVRRSVPVLPEAIALALLTAAMSVTSRRFIILYAMGFALLLAPFVGALLRQRSFQLLALPLLAGALLWGTQRLAPYPLRFDVAYHYLTAEYTYPEGLADFVEQNRLEGRTFAYYNWGGYLHWRGDGALQVFLDGRANTLFDDQTYLEYVSVLGGRPGWIGRVERSGAQLFLWPRSRGGAQLIRTLQGTGRWKTLYEDARGALLAHESFALPLTLRFPSGNVAADLSEAYAATRRGEAERALAAASRAYAQRPWDQGACSWMRSALRARGRVADGEQVTRDCREWFPSRYLR